MNNTTLLEIKKEQEEILKKYKLDEKSILEFRKKIKKVDEEKSNELGEQIYQLLLKKNKNESNNQSGSEQNSNSLNNQDGDQNESVDLDKMLKLIYSGANLEYKEPKKGNFPLLKCMIEGHFDAAYLLLRAGANVNQTNNYLTTSLMASAKRGFTELMEVLILLGADVNSRCLDGDTALFMAKRHNFPDAVDLLLKNGALINNRNMNNESIFDIGGDFDFSSINIEDKSILPKEKKTTLEDVNNLLNEAINSMKSICNDVISIEDNNNNNLNSTITSPVENLENDKDDEFNETYNNLPVICNLAEFKYFLEKISKSNTETDSFEDLGNNESFSSDELESWSSPSTLGKLR